MAGKTKTKAERGRPSSFKQEIADEICAHLSIGASIRTVCKPEHMPSIQTFYTWLRTYPEFLEQYTRAKQESADAMAEDILDISDDGTNDYMLVQRGDNEGWQLNGEAVQRSRLRVESRKWLMAKMKPKIYGDKIDMTSDGEKLGVTISAEQADQLIRARAQRQSDT